MIFHKFLRKEYLIIPTVILVAGILFLTKNHNSKPNNPLDKPIVQSTVAGGSAEQIHNECESQKQPTLIFDCYTQDFKEYIAARDARQALELLDQLDHLGGYAHDNCHPLSHKIGNLSLHQYGTVLAASPYYLPVCYSGYYHGLLEEYLSVAPDYHSGIITACGNLEDKVYFNWFQCTHGLGHGIMQYREDDVLQSVKDCDMLKNENFARDICYGGVFMENITTDAKTGHKSKFIKADDPIYPCNIVDKQYKNACYFLSSSMILRLNNYNFQAGFKTCDTAEKDYRYLCYQSMGRDVSGTFQRNIIKVNELCPQGNPAFIGDCYFGAVRDFINEKGQFDTAMPMCTATPQGYKSNCYSAVIYDLGLLKKGQDYVDVCNQMPQMYKSQCLSLRKA